MPAIALTGAVIIEQKEHDNTIRWMQKCEKCGWVENGTHTQAAPGRGSTSSTSFTCPECKGRQDVRSQGV